MTTAVTTTGGNALAMSVSINNYEALKKLGEEVAKSGIFGEITTAQAEVSLVTMKDEGLSMAEFKRRYRWIGNELSRIPNSLLGDFKRIGGKYTIIQADGEACEIAFENGDIKYRLRITMEQMLKTDVPFAKDGKSLKKNWKNFPDDMLFARVCGKALRRIAPELMGGVYTDGEAMDFDAVKPAEIGAEEVTARIKAVSASPIAVDFAKCPIEGKSFGKPWAEYDTAALDKILKVDRVKFPAMTDEHFAAIEEELKRREDEAKDEQSEQEAEVIEAEAEVVK